MVRRTLAALLLAFCIGVLHPSPAGALVLEMQIEVAPGDQAKLEESIDAIHSFFEQQSGFIRASLNPSGVVGTTSRRNGKPLLTTRMLSNKRTSQPSLRRFQVQQLDCQQPFP